MKYIQRKDKYTGQLETVDEFETSSEARAMAIEYRISDQSAHYYVSNRPCKDWNNA
jgi:hypothetical protein